MLQIEEISLVIPTYHRGPDSPFPPLTFSGRRPGRRPAFPYHAQDDIDIASMIRDDACTHRVVRFSNGLLEAIVLPGMNGRLHSLKDMRTGRELFYRNRVIKPALVGLRGAWLSGGIEFNTPTVGHSVSTVSPVFRGTEQSAAEVAVTVGDIDRTTRQRWCMRMSLKQGRAALDMTLAVTNPNHYRERLYYWENAAVPATEDLRFVCHCDWTVGAVSQPFPIRDGIDRSFHVNNPTPLDHFGYRSHADFFGAYYASTRCGTYHIAPRFDLPGQKYFTWGTRDDNRIWERFLTDDDGQYVEIQAGLLETQWITGWLQPQETVRASGSWFGTEDMGEATWATPEVAAAVREEDGKLLIDLYAIELAGTVTTTLTRDGHTQSATADSSPGQISRFSFAGTGPASVTLRGDDGRLLLREQWHGAQHQGLSPDRDSAAPEQWAMQARRSSPVAKADVAVQFHRWAEARALLREEDASANAGKATLLEVEIEVKTGRHEQALRQARQALDDSPGDEALHALAAAAAAALFRRSAAPDAYAAVWDHALAARRDQRHTAGMLRLLAETELVAGHLLQGKHLLSQFVDQHPEHEDARCLLAAACRHCGDTAGADAALRTSQQPFGMFAALESALLHDDVPSPAMPELPAGRPWGAVYRIELLLEAIIGYWRVGFLEDVEHLLTALERQVPAMGGHPLTHLLRMDAAETRNDAAAARSHAAAAARCPVDWVVPSRWETMGLLERAMEHLPGEQRGCLPYLLGIIRAESADVDGAVALLRQTTRKDDDLLRACVAKALADWADVVAGDCAEAIGHLEVALKALPGDRRLMLHLDDCLRRDHDISRREALWAGIPDELAQRGDVTFACARLDLDRDRPAEAIASLASRQFSVFEGGTSVRRLYVDACLIGAVHAFLGGDTGAATQRCDRVFEYPENLGAASYLGEHSRLARYLRGAFAQLADRGDEAVQWWRDVLSRGGDTVTYSVTGQDTARIGRLDERLALTLANARLNGPSEPGEAIPLQPTDTAEATAKHLAQAVAAKQGDAATLAKAAAARFPCDTLIKILGRITAVEDLLDKRVEPRGHGSHTEGRARP